MTSFSGKSFADPPYSFSDCCTWTAQRLTRDSNKFGHDDRVDHKVITDYYNGLNKHTHLQLQQSPTSRNEDVCSDCPPANLNREKRRHTGQSLVPPRKR